MAQGFTKEEITDYTNLLIKILNATERPLSFDMASSTLKVTIPGTPSVLISGGSTTSGLDQQFRDMVQSRVNYSILRKNQA